MRPGQNKRMRGRPANNRRGPNPLTRSYESNGPDVKIRGNAHHVAEKYLQLARDAHTSGDPVAAENYLQHAEHYFRLIAAAQTAQLQAQNGGRAQGEGEIEEAEDEDEGGVLADRFASPSERAPQVAYNGAQPQFGPQPNIGPSPQFGYGERQPYESDRPVQPDRGFAPRPGRGPDRGPRPDRPFPDRPDVNREPRPVEGRAREFRPYRDPNPPQPREAPEAANALPSFITAAPRVPTVEEEGEPVVQPAAEFTAPEPETFEAPAPRPEPAADARFPRGRRRRLRSPYGFHAAGHSEEGQTPPAPPAPEDTPVSE